MHDADCIAGRTMFSTAASHPHSGNSKISCTSLTRYSANISNIRASARRQSSLTGTSATTRGSSSVVRYREHRLRKAPLASSGHALVHPNFKYESGSYRGHETAYNQPLFELLLGAPSLETTADPCHALSGMWRIGSTRSSRVAEPLHTSRWRVRWLAFRNCTPQNRHSCRLLLRISSCIRSSSTGVSDNTGRHGFARSRWILYEDRRFVSYPQRRHLNSVCWSRGMDFVQTTTPRPVLFCYNHVLSK